MTMRFRSEERSLKTCLVTHLVQISACIRKGDRSGPYPLVV